MNNALTLLPDLKRLYNFRKNEELGLDPFSFRLGEQNIYCWWKCPDCGYEWNSTISSRLDRKDGKIIVRQCQNCYYNDPSRITPVASMPKLMRFWDFKENKKHGLDPNLVSAYSPLPANWHCKKCDYRWPATIRSRAVLIVWRLNILISLLCGPTKINFLRIRSFLILLWHSGPVLLAMGRIILLGLIK